MVFFCCDKFDNDNRWISIVKLHNVFHTFMSTVVNDSKFVQHFSYLPWLILPFYFISNDSTLCATFFSPKVHIYHECNRKL